MYLQNYYEKKIFIAYGLAYKNNLRISQTYFLVKYCIGELQKSCASFCENLVPKLDIVSDSQRQIILSCLSGIVHFSVLYPVIIYHKLVSCITFFKGLQRKIKILVNANLNQNLYSFLYLNECYIKPNCNYSTVHLIYAERMT